MTKSRETQISLPQTPYYHCTVRCVRRAYLCGQDQTTNTDYTHRKQWLQTRLLQLANIFAIDICAYAIMSNHYHAILHVNQQRATNWTDHEIAAQWTQLFSTPPHIKKWLNNNDLNPQEQQNVKETLETWRTRLTDISWFMRSINEYIARKANKEDNCKGRFWEGRFKSQALLDETALLTCMAYVDLNPIRARIAELPENADFTSIQQRIHELGTKQDTKENKPDTDETLAPLHPFNEQDDTNIPFTFAEYLKLIDWTGRIIRQDKTSVIREDAPPILRRLGIAENAWLDSVQHCEKHFSGPMGRVQRLREVAREIGVKWLKGIGAAGRLYEQGTVMRL